ncbi:phosphatidylinositol-4-phosphate 5-kinase fab1 [Anopheles sinensis]|uniref:Phosphatidylinositol-4-phosphate 5-kinase fab1 n=1 Tax=Anopheles sinensis TaxID=74873 RepID=A0A084WIW6_ANOSI|nr:phosphatidylinositol-4-phosphate 5-kinase fab1 [Anopheles sinensis]
MPLFQSSVEVSAIISGRANNRVRARLPLSLARCAAQATDNISGEFRLVVEHKGQMRWTGTIAKGSKIAPFSIPPSPSSPRVDNGARRRTRYPSNVEQNRQWKKVTFTLGRMESVLLVNMV